jgi:hypothetical protein
MQAEGKGRERRKSAKSFILGRFLACFALTRGPEPL